MKRYLIAGLLVWVPLGITIWVIHWLNPLSPAVEAVRAPLFLGTMPFWGDALYLVVASISALALGAFVFIRVDDQIAIEV